MLATVARADGAGVLIYSEFNNQQLVLLADHKKENQVQRGWSTLGGTVKENESILAAAIREVFEESNGKIKAKELIALIDPDIKTETPGFTIYFAKIDYIPATEFEYIRQNSDALDFSERGPYAWVPWPEIQRAANQFEVLSADSAVKIVKVKELYLPVKRQTDWYFSAFLSTIKQITKTRNGPLKNIECAKIH